jgi:hypothetical protein
MKKPGIGVGLMLAGSATALGAVIGASRTPTAPSTRLSGAEGGAIVAALGSAAVAGLLLVEGKAKKAAGAALATSSLVAFGALLLQNWPKAAVPAA